MEGFVCPVCKIKCKSSVLLQAHFQEIHMKDLNEEREDNAEKCEKCNIEFGALMNRKHECTVCAKIVCHKCSPQRWHVSCIPAHRNVNSKKMVRVCKDCVSVTRKLHEYISEGETEKARQCFREHSSIVFLNHTSPFADDSNGTKQLTPLHVAARSGCVETIQWLIEQHGCDPKCQSGVDKITALEIAIENQDLDAALFLFSKGACVESVRPENALRKMLAETMDRVFLLDPSTHLQTKRIEPNISKDSTMECDEKRCNICINAFGMFRSGHECCACTRMVCGTCAPNRWHESCVPKDQNFNNKKYVRICMECHRITEKFHNAICEADTTTARNLLREHSNKLFLSCRSAFIGDNPSKQRFTPLHGAASSGSIEMLSFIVDENGCLMDIRTKCAGGSTPLETAAQCGHFNSVMYLYKKGGNLRSIRSVRLVKCLLRNALKRLLMLMRSEIELKIVKENKISSSDHQMKKKKQPPAIPKIRPADFVKKKKNNAKTSPPPITKVAKKKNVKSGSSEIIDEVVKTKHTSCMMKKKPPPLPKIVGSRTNKLKELEEREEKEEEKLPSRLAPQTIPPVLNIRSKNDILESSMTTTSDDPFSSCLSNISQIGSMFLGELVDDGFDMFDDLTPDVPSTRLKSPMNDASSRVILRHRKSSSLPDPCDVCGSNQDTFDAPKIDCVDSSLGRMSLTFCFHCERKCLNCSKVIGRENLTAYTSKVEELEKASGKGKKTWNTLYLFCSEECMNTMLGEEEGTVKMMVI